jgi:NhaA family Na+:H+ antiporter
MGRPGSKRFRNGLTIIRSERYSAGLLLGAALLGLILANTAAGPWLLDLQATPLAVPLVNLNLSLGHWISDGLLAIFFFIIAVELRHELAVGQLNSFHRAFAPAIAALGGVVTPALVFVAITAGSGFERGWPIPTATDIAFSLGILAVFGKGLPTQLRIFLLALAVLDDLVAILIIAIFFTHQVSMVSLGLSVAAVVLFGLLSRYVKKGRPWLMWGMTGVAIVAWYFMAESGVHPTIAGVALGTVMARRPAAATAHALIPLSNGVCLPLFAFSAALVAFPAVGVDRLSPAFWGILVGLPVGKFVGITVAGWLISLLARRRTASSLSLANIMTIGILGGIGFTVSLLMNELAFSRTPGVAGEGTLAVLLGSGISIVAAAVVVAARARHYRRAVPGP